MKRSILKTIKSLTEVHNPKRPHIKGHRTLGNLKRRTSSIKMTANQNMAGGSRYDNEAKRLAEAAIKKVIKKDSEEGKGKTTTGQKPDKIETEVTHNTLVGTM